MPAGAVEHLGGLYMLIIVNTIAMKKQKSTNSHGSIL
jgi:hypothetical protein